MNGNGRAVRLEELARELGGVVEGDPEIAIRGVSGLDDAAPGMVVRVEHPRFLKSALAGPASAILASPALGPVTKPCIRVENVRMAFLRCLELFTRDETPPPGVHPTAVLGEEVTMGEGCSIAAYAVLGARVRLGDGVVIHPHVVVGDDVEIGDGSVLFPHVSLYPRTVLGRRVRVHAGSVIGADGYGYEWSGSRHLKRPHNGRVRLEDEVEVGSNTTIDRATTDETVIGAGTKIDNLVQVGHNVRTGQHCLLISQVGIAGSATLGNGVVLAGQAGVNSGVRIGDGVQVAGRGGVWGDQLEPGILSGNPARPHREQMRIQAALNQLPELLRRVRELERRLEAAEPEPGGSGPSPGG